MGRKGIEVTEHVELDLLLVYWDFPHITTIARVYRGTFPLGISCVEETVVFGVRGQRSDLCLTV